MRVVVSLAFDQVEVCFICEDGEPRLLHQAMHLVKLTPSISLANVTHTGYRNAMSRSQEVSSKGRSDEDNTKDKTFASNS